MTARIGTKFQDQQINHMKYILSILLFIPLFAFSQANNSYIRYVNQSELLTGKFSSGEYLGDNTGANYRVTDIPNSLWNNNKPDSLFVYQVDDANPNGFNGFRMSEGLDNQSMWTRAGTPDGFSVIPDSDIAPDGTRTAERFVYANSSPLRGNTNTPIVAGRTYTVSLYIKVPVAACNNDMRVRIELNDYSAGRVTIQPDTVNKGWSRYSATLTANATNQNPFVDIDFGAPGTDVGDTLILWGLQFEDDNLPTKYKRTEITPTTYGKVYLHYIPRDGIVRIDELYNTRFADYQLIQRALNYCNSVNNVSTVLIEKDRTLTDTITIPVNVCLSGIATGNSLSATYDKIKTRVFLDLSNATKTAITFKGEGNTQLTAHGLKDIVFIPVSSAYALLNTGNTIRSQVEHVHLSSWSTSESKWLQYGIILGAGSLQNTIHDVSLMHLKTAGVWSVSSSIMKLDNIRVTVAAHGVVVSDGALYVDGGWFENLDSSAVVFSGNLCHLNRIYTEDVPKNTGIASRTLNIKKCSVFSVTNSDLQGGQLIADSLQTYIYLDSVRVATVMNNQIQASRINLVTTASTGYVTWINNVESNNSDQKVIEGFQYVDKDRITIIGSTGQNSFMPSDNWIPHLKTNYIGFGAGYTASEASELQVTEPTIIYVKTINGVFPITGFYGFDGNEWLRLNN